MSEQKLYSIGKVSKICDVSQRMLRYYESLGLIVPDRIAEPSRYRYYSIQTMRRVQVIRYLIDEGFRLEEIREVLCNEDLDHFEQLFLQKIQQTQEKIEHDHQRLDSLRAWYALLYAGGRGCGGVPGNGILHAVQAQRPFHGGYGRCVLLSVRLCRGAHGGALPACNAAAGHVSQ